MTSPLLGVSRSSSWGYTTGGRQIRITQVRSALGRQKIQQRMLDALGIKRHQQSVVHDDTPAIRGIIAKLDHLLKVTEVD